MRNLVTAAVPVVLLIVIICIFWQQGKQFGVGISRRENEWTAADRANKEAQIYAVCQRFKQGERVALSNLAKAHDADGSDLSGKLCCYDEKGQLLTGFFDTDQPGIRTLSWEVVSICTGRRIRKKMIVLVDGRIET